MYMGASIDTAENTELVSHWRGEGSGRVTTAMNNGDKQKQRIMLDNRLPKVGVVLG